MYVCSVTLLRFDKQGEQDGDRLKTRLIGFLQEPYEQLRYTWSSQTLLLNLSPSQDPCPRQS